jgi:hypothetical protein
MVGPSGRFSNFPWLGNPLRLFGVLLNPVNNHPVIGRSCRCRNPSLSEARHGAPACSCFQGRRALTPGGGVLSKSFWLGGRLLPGGSSSSQRERGPMRTSFITSMQVRVETPPKLVSNRARSITSLSGSLLWLAYLNIYRLPFNCPPPPPL